MKIAYKILIVFVLSISTVATLYFLQEPPAKNGFSRGRVDTVKQVEVLNLKYNSYYIGGLSNGRIYLGNTTAPRVLLSCDYNLKYTKREIIPFTFGNSISWKLARIQVDSPAVYLSEYKTPSFVSAELPFKRDKEEYYNLTGLHLDLMEVLSSNSLIINGHNPVLSQKALQKISLNAAINSEKVYKHEIQQNSNFTIDGFMSFNREQGAILFTYYYRNQFLVLDTNMNLLYKGKTIDTNTVAKIEVGEYQSGGKQIRTMSKPALRVNKSSYSNGNFIYIETALAADNEDLRVFNRHVVIDVYVLSNGKYSHSIYLPKYNGETLTDFAVKHDLLIALYERHLVTYQLKFDRLPL
ncbi:hypothetical protein [Chitinophaga sp. CF418]|uniref:hypothetical protein n=1 Tax=Chitinophaga sp. CF418 TaxID=1855287 RepID=UPI00090F8FBC|nr:hypothetical protein [Chitinophaga sp. CF418]SHN45504.1 hypothetical protein SAMN05216311_12080 [Chitinophaga sp. CF418]